MTNLTLNNPQEYAQLEEKGGATTTPFQNIAQALFPTNTNAEKMGSFLDAWLMSNNGQG